MADVVAPVVEGIVSAVAGGLLLALSGKGWRYYSQRQGRMAGWWWQVSYAPQENTAYRLDNPIPAPDEEAVWSVELVRVRQAARSIELSGSMSRVHSRDLNRGWHFNGRDDGWLVEGNYWPVRGTGISGTFQLWRCNPGYWKGKYTESSSQVVASGLHSELKSGSVEWIRYDSRSPQEVDVIERLQKEQPDPDDRTEIPRAARKKLARRADWLKGEGTGSPER